MFLIPRRSDASCSNPGGQVALCMGSVKINSPPGFNTRFTSLKVTPQVDLED